VTLAESWRVLGECIAPESDVSPGTRTERSWHALFGNRPRSLLLPAGNRRARRNAMRVFLPNLWRELYARLRLHAHDLLGRRARLPALTLAPPAALALSEWLKGQLGHRLPAAAESQLAFLIGTPGPYQKASILVMSATGDPQMLVKLALRSGANKMVQAESVWLRVLNACEPMDASVPRLIDDGRASNGNRYVAQSIVTGKPGSQSFTAAHSDFLGRLGSIDRHVCEFQASPLRRLLDDGLAELSPSLSAPRRDLFEAALEDCNVRLDAWRGPFVISHGDFAAWNIRTADTLCVFDWEYANAGMSPLFDPLHFQLIGPASSGRSLRVREFNQALAVAKQFAVETYPEFKWDARIVAAHGLAYLLHTLQFYGVSRGELLEHHPVIRNFCDLIEARQLWLL